MSLVLQAAVLGAVAGLAQIPHCAAMCGPVAAFGCSRRPGASAPWRYQAGRTLGYAFLGSLAGDIGVWLSSSVSSAVTGALVSWSLALALVLTASRLWPRPLAERSSRGAAGPSERRASAGELVELRRGPAASSRRIHGGGLAETGVATKLTALLPKEPFIFGMLTALLPCGALATALLMAAGMASPMRGAAVMVGFATTSGLALAGVGWIAARLRVLRGSAWSRGLAAALAAAALLLAYRPVPRLQAAWNGDSAESSCHGGHLRDAE